MATNVKNRVMPFKIWIFLLFSKHPSLSREGASATVQLTAFARRLHVSKARLMEHLSWLEAEGLIANLVSEGPKASESKMTLLLPNDARWDIGSTFDPSRVGSEGKGNP